MSAGHVIVQIRRKQGRFDFIPAYSTAHLLQGVCHLTHFPEPKSDESHKIPRHISAGNNEKQRLSRLKFETHKEEIYMLLAQGRGIKTVSERFRMGHAALQRYLDEECARLESTNDNSQT